jgi:hypothetical protein
MLLALLVGPVRPCPSPHAASANAQPTENTVQLDFVIAIPNAITMINRGGSRAGRVERDLVFPGVQAAKGP